jgi:hypothetical protein
MFQKSLFFGTPAKEGSMGGIYEHKDGLARPRIVCDACDGPIRDFHDGIVFIEEPPVEQEADQTRARHSHKKQACQMKVRASVGHQDVNGMCEELGSYLVMIALDVGLFPADFQERFDSLRDLGVVAASLPTDETETCVTGDS